MLDVQYTGEVVLVHRTGTWEPKEIRALPDMAAKGLLKERPGDMRLNVPDKPKPKAKAKAKPTDGGVENG